MTCKEIRVFNKYLCVVPLTRDRHWNNHQNFNSKVTLMLKKQVNEHTTTKATNLFDLRQLGFEFG